MKIKWGLVTGFVIVAVVACHFLMPRSPQIVGRWSGDVTEVFNKIFARYGVAAKEASSVVVFHDDGTCSGDDYATLVVVSGPRKGARIEYHQRVKGTYEFKNKTGIIKDTAGERIVNGRTIKIKIPESIPIEFELKGNSTLVMKEDYGVGGQYKYALKRK